MQVARCLLRSCLADCYQLPVTAFNLSLCVILVSLATNLNQLIHLLYDGQRVSVVKRVGLRAPI